jgi:hypothetical protein
MVLLFVRSFDLRAQPPKEGEFDRAWFRLNDEETNQTLDYSNIKNIEMPEGFEEYAPAEEAEDGAEPAPRTEPIYLAGRLFLD